MPLNFPNSPVIEQLYSFGGKTWQWSGSSWEALPYDYSLIYSTVLAESAMWDSTYTTVSANSAAWDDTSTVVQSNSTSWAAGGSEPLVVQNLGTIGGPVTFDISLGESSIALLSADTTLTLTNAPSGESGMLIFGHDTNGTWTLNITGQNTEARVMVGDLANFATAGEAFGPYDIGGYNIGSVSWFNDGQDYYLYVSDIKAAADPLNLNR